MSIQALSAYTFNSRYARYRPLEKRRETWEEAVQRVFDMHRQKYAPQISEKPELAELIAFAQKMQKKKRVLASQRSLQFGGESLFKHELKMYGCLGTHINRVRVFQETMYGLLCGCGVGFSVQEQHVLMLPEIQSHSAMAENQGPEFEVEDSIEGWADAVGHLMNSFFVDPDATRPVPHQACFSFRLIRPEGAMIAGQFKAPGPDPLARSLKNIEKVIRARIEMTNFHDPNTKFYRRLRPIDCYDITMHIADAVLSGGVRRSATLCLFTHTDEDMINAKIGNWFSTNPQRARSNNSAALLKGSVSREEFNRLIKSTKEFGEPGFVWLNDLDIIVNPCCEIGMMPIFEGAPGWQACNLTEINGKWCSSKENFLDACRASAIIGTLQAGYTDLKYFEQTSIDILKNEALLGCSITGWMDNPEILFDPAIQEEGAELILKVNAEVAELLGINPAARTTCVKPSGTTSCLLGTASGIHPHHAKRYIRRVQANVNEFCLQVTEEKNPLAVEPSVWGVATKDRVISFLCEVPPGSVVKNQLDAIDLLEKVKLTQKHWVEKGTRNRDHVVRHNVSNTITVRPHEWALVEDFIFDNQEWFAGVSLLSSSGDLDYAQAPFATVLTPVELVKEYGDASVFASGLIVAALEAFDDNLWAACDSALGLGEEIVWPLKFSFEVKPEPRSWIKELLCRVFDLERPTPQCIQFEDAYANFKYRSKIAFEKRDWIRRLKQFAERYFKGDIRHATHCLKHVSLWKTWCDLSREYVEIDWSECHEDTQAIVAADTLAATACSGGACELK